MSTLEVLAINEAIQTLNKLQTATASGSLFAYQKLRSAEKYLNQRIADHFAE